MSKKLTVKQAADALGYHPNHVYRLLREKTIRGQQFSRVWMIDQKEVDRIKALQGENGRL